MTFIEAALSLLAKSRRALTADQLADKAVKEELLSKPGNNPVRSMKSALGREVKKGDDSRVARSGEDKWKLAKADAPAKATTKKAKKKATAKKATAKKATAKKATAKKTTAKKATAKKATAKKATAKKATAKKATAKKKTEDAPTVDESTSEVTPTSEKASGKKKKSAKKKASARKTRAADKDKGVSKSAVEGDAVEATQGSESAAPEPDKAAEGTGKKSRRRRRKGRKDREATPAAELAVDPAAAEQLGDVLAPKETPRRAAPPVTPEEADIAAIYGDELSGTEPGAAYAEYRDERTDDEDRPMSPELVATRKDRQKRERRERRKRQKTEPRQRTERARKSSETRESGERTDSGTASDSGPSWAGERARAASFYEAGNALGGHAASVLGDLDKTQSLRGKQLAQLMSKRGLLSGAPEKMWRHLEAALLHDESSYRAHGLRARIAYRGRGTFEIGTTAGDRQLAEAESALAAAVANTVSAAHRALSERLGNLNQGGMERVAHIYLVRQGFSDIQWIKRSQHASYALANAPDGLGQQLIGVSFGEHPVERGGVGELRVGVQAKKLSSGLLLAARGLTARAQNELRRYGPSLSVLVGERFVAALIDSGIGVNQAHISVPMLDERWLGDVNGD